MATLFALPVCQSLKNKLHPRKTNTHSKHGEGAADRAERISRPRNNRGERSQTVCGEAACCKHGEREGKSITPAVEMHVSGRTFSFACTLLQMPRYPHQSSYMGSYVWIQLCASLPLERLPAERHGWPRVKWRWIYLAWLPLVGTIRYTGTQIQTDTEIPVLQIIVRVNQSQSTAYFLEGFILQSLMRYKIKRRLWQISVITVYINILQESFLPRNLKYLQGDWILPQLRFQQE